MASGEPHDLPLDKRFTLFFDFLGASQAASQWPRDRLYQFLDMLISISTLESGEEVSGEPLDDGGYRLTVKPEVTTFSDNVVLSYHGTSESDLRDMPNPPGLMQQIWAEITCKDAVRIVAGVAEFALRVGVLLRGGLCYDQLYHQNGVVFGQGLVCAYDLERTVAHWPRVIVHQNIIDQLSPEFLSEGFVEKDGGLWTLNYLPHMKRAGSNSGEMDAEQFRRWRAAHLATIDKQIAALQEPADARPLEKWLWFRDGFSAATCS